MKVNQHQTVKTIYAQWRRIRREELKPSTNAAEEQALTHFLIVFGQEEISNVEPERLQAFLLDNKLAAATRRLRRQYLKAFFDYAVACGFLTDNPIDFVVLPRYRQTIEEIHQTRNHFLSRDELAQVLDNPPKTGNSIRICLIIEFLFLTGLRIGELLALRWQDVEEDCLQIKHTLDCHSCNERKRKLLSPKTLSSYRKLALSQRSQAIMAYFASNLTDPEFIFVNEAGQTFYRNTLNRAFRRLCEAHLNPNKKYNLHMLRHSHISLLIELGVPLKAIMERVGHKDERITLQIYSHISQQVQDDLLAKLNNIEC